jgi:hypothetical protein
MKMKGIKSISLTRKTFLATTLLGALLASLTAQAYFPRYVWVTLYYDGNGAVVGADSWGDCSLGSWGQPTGNSTTQVYDCDGELPF